MGWRKNLYDLGEDGAFGIAQGVLATVEGLGLYELQAGGFGREVTGVAFLKDDQWVATGHPRELRVVNENGDRVRVLTGLGDLAYSLAISADGRWIVAGGEDGVIRIWDRDTEAPRWQFPPPAAPVASAAP